MIQDYIKPRILIVDDRKANIIALERTLRRLDVDIYSALSGNEALTLTLNMDFAVILLDVQMPGMDGFEVADYLRSDEQTRHIPIIFVTAKSLLESDIKKGYETGAIDYILKPIVPHILISKITVLLKLYQYNQTLLESAERKQNIILDNTSDGLFLIRTSPGLSDTFEKVSRASLDLTGVQKDDLETLRIDDLLTDRFKNNVNKIVSELTRERKKIFECELENRTTRANVPVEISLQKTAVLETEYIVMSVRDISRQKNAEDTLKKELALNKTIAKVSKELLSESYDIKKVSDVILDYARELTGSEHGFVSSFNKKTFKQKRHSFTQMFDNITLAGNEKKRHSSNDEDVYSEDAYNEDAYNEDAYNEESILNIEKAFFSNTPSEHPGMMAFAKSDLPLKNLLVVPYIIGKNILGVVFLANANRDYSNRDLISIHHLSDVFALAIQRQEHEKERIRLELNLRQLQRTEAIGALAGGIAHDFNNLLSPIVGFSEMLAEDLSGEKQLSEYAKEILKSSLRAKDLVKQILTFSRQTEQKMIPLKPYLIIEEVLKLIEPTTPSTIEIKKKIDPDTRLISADPTRIHQIVMNLITNAIDAMQEKGGVLSITLENMKRGLDQKGINLASGQYIVLTVSDTGVGMTQETHRKIFDPYFSTKPLGKGNGLGLSVVHGIVKNYKGKINVKTAPEQGTSFEIYLPALSKYDIQKEKIKPAKELKGDEKILLVDDESPVLQTEKKILERLGYKVDDTASSNDALNKIKLCPDKYDLVITDMTMPGLTGDKLTREIKKINLKLPVIICSGYSEKIMLQDITEIGADALLMKPIIKEDLARAIKKALKIVL